MTLWNYMRISPVLLVSALVAGSTACHSSRYYVAEGDRALASGKSAEAILALRKAVQKDPKSAVAYYKLGVAQRKTNDNPGARDSLEHAVGLDPDSVEAQAELGDLYLGSYLLQSVKMLALYDKIARIADWLLSKDSKSYAGLRLRGYLAMSDKRPDQALNYFRQANEIKPMQPDIGLSIAQALFLTGHADDARRTAWDFIHHDPSFTALYDVLFQYELTSGHAGEAEDVLRTKISNNPGNAAFQVQLAEFYWRRGRKAEATPLLQNILAAGAKSDAYARVAEFYQRAGEWDQALAILDLWFKARPEDKQAYRQRRAALLARAGKPEEALHLLEDVLHDDPSVTDARKARGLILLASNKKTDQESALKEWQALAAAAGDDEDVRFQLGRAFAANGKNDEARAEFERALKLQPADTRVILALAELASRSKQFQKSLQYSESVLAADPKIRDARLLHATALVGLGRLTEARAEYTKLASDEPRFVEAKLQLALLNASQKRFKDAEKLFSELHLSDSRDFRPLEGLVEVYGAQGQWKKAIDAINSSVEHSPDSPALRSLLAATAVRAGSIDLAIEQYEWIAQHSSSPEPLTALGQLYQRRHELQKSADALQKACALAPNDWKTFTRLAIVQQEAGSRSEASANYMRALQLGANDPDLFNNLAFLYAETGSNFEQALSLAQKALSISPSNPQYADTLGIVYLRKNDSPSAIRIFENLLNKHPKDPAFRYHLGLALVRNGNVERGRHEMERAIHADPSLRTELIGNLAAPVR